MIQTENNKIIDILVSDCFKYEEHQQLAEDAERYRIEQEPTGINNDNITL